MLKKIDSFYVWFPIPAELIKVEENTATIFLPKIRDGNGVGKAIKKDIIIAAGFEICDSRNQAVLYFH